MAEGAGARPPTPLLFGRHMRAALNSDPRRARRIRRYIGQLRPANTVVSKRYYGIPPLRPFADPKTNPDPKVHFQRASTGADPESLRLFPSRPDSCFRGFKPSPSGCHTRKRLGSGGIIMIFNRNLISAGKLPPSASIQGILCTLWRGTRTRESPAGISSAGVAVDAPNMVLHGQFRYEVTHEWLSQQGFVNHSDKFPGFALVDPRLPPAVTPELYPSRTAKTSHPLRFILPGLRSAQAAVEACDAIIQLTAPHHADDWHEYE